jgi:hypothetical protein
VAFSRTFAVLCGEADLTVDICAGFAEYLGRLVCSSRDLGSEIII